VTLLFGATHGGATSWFHIGPMNIEPEELVKVAMLVFLASYLSEHEEILRVGTVQFGWFSLPDWRTLGPFLVMGGFSLALLAAQKSLGTALVFYSLYVLVLYVVTERLLYLGISVPVFLSTGVLAYFLFGHVQVRVQTWLDPWVDTSGNGYQIAQSLFAIGGGKILGTGLGNGIGASQVPASTTDFIFSVIAEELGFAGAMAVLILFLVVILRSFVVSMRAPDRFGQILAAGIGILVGTETLIILAGVTKLLPLTGIPLPWVSYGGSSLLIHFLLLGILANISHSAEVGPMNLKTRGREYTA
jgi:cell division protein FtsW (lipid II flippase)